jgi:hypothetical protein
MPGGAEKKRVIWCGYISSSIQGEVFGIARYETRKKRFIKIAIISEYHDSEQLFL